MCADLLLIPLIAISFVSVMCCWKKKKSRKTKSKKNLNGSAKSDRQPAPFPEGCCDPWYKTLTGLESEKVFGPVEPFEKNVASSFSYKTPSSVEAEERKKQDMVLTYDPKFETVHFESHDVTKDEESTKRATAPFSPTPQPVQVAPPKEPQVLTPSPDQQAAPRPPFAQQAVSPENNHPSPLKTPPHPLVPRFPFQAQSRPRPYMYIPPTTHIVGPEPSVFPLIRNPQFRPPHPPQSP